MVLRAQLLFQSETYTECVRFRIATWFCQFRFSKSPWWRQLAYKTWACRVIPNWVKLGGPGQCRRTACSPVRRHDRYQEGAQCGHTVFGQNSGHTVCSNYPTVCAQHRPIKPSPRNSRLTLLLRLPTGALTRVKINNIDNRGSADILSFLPSLLPIFRCPEKKRKKVDTRLDTTHGAIITSSQFREALKERKEKLKKKRSPAVLNDPAKAQQKSGKKPKCKAKPKRVSKATSKRL